MPPDKNFAVICRLLLIRQRTEPQGDDLSQRCNRSRVKARLLRHGKELRFDVPTLAVDEAFAAGLLDRVAQRAILLRRDRGPRCQSLHEPRGNDASFLFAETVDRRGVKPATLRAKRREQLGPSIRRNGAYRYTMVGKKLIELLRRQNIMRTLPADGDPRSSLVQPRSGDTGIGGESEQDRL